MGPEIKDNKVPECTADGQRIVDRFVAELTSTEALEGYLDRKQVSDFLIELACRSGFKGSDPIAAVRHLEAQLGLHNLTVEVVETAAHELPRVPNFRAQAVGAKAVRLAAALTDQVNTSVDAPLEAL